MKLSLPISVFAGLALCQVTLADVPVRVKVTHGSQVIKGATIYIVGPEGRPYSPITLHTDATGYANGNLPRGAGLYHIFGNKSDQGTSAVGDLRVAAGDTTTQFSLSLNNLPAQSIVETHVFDQNTSRPIVGLSVEPFLVTTTVTPVPAIRTDAHGVAVLTYPSSDTTACFRTNFTSSLYLPQSFPIYRDPSAPRTTKILLVSMTPDPNARYQGTFKGNGGNGKPPIKPPVKPPIKPLF